MSEDDNNADLLKEVSAQVEIKALIALGVIEMVRRQVVCFHPGPGLDIRSDRIRGFLECVPFLGRSTALVFCAPSRRKTDVRDEIRRVVTDNSETGVNIFESVGIDDDLVWDDSLLFVPSADGSRVPGNPWTHYVILKFRNRPLKLHVLHLGMNGDEAQRFFLQPHGIRASCIIE